MRPDPRFQGLDKPFWANVRLISQQVGYTLKRPRSGKHAQKDTGESGTVKVPQPVEIIEAFHALGLNIGSLFSAKGQPTRLGRQLLAYFAYRANILNGSVAPLLMDKHRALREFEQLRRRLCPACPIPMNKQKGEKKAPAFLTGMVNMLIEANAGGLPCDYDPRELTVVTRNGRPFRTLARRVDGAFPSPVNPIAVWEIKEYYYTTTFGSRVADGVYETLLDGMELEDLSAAGVDVLHYLILDDRFTWWECGRSYLCRVIDMLHMGYVDEVLFGAEVLTRLPEIVREWVDIARSRR
jgi:hypothetical protein